MDNYPDLRRQKAEYVMAVQSVAASIQNLLLTAHAEGLGTCWFCAPLFCKKIVKDILKIPKNIEPQAFVTLGYPKEKSNAPQRKTLRNVVNYNFWGLKF